ncbi:uncharacterized protein LOC111341861 isoform X3 [Stylophora pistillata]|uniref:uncharacterized protein LOC111341861 isoform X3 n=1 Tax=Stylophora pistillata TaxID=50429 RepID=UPI000C04C364|nr:uncharacterized protein LOC111341861 isoform X3 [Stylophora pistillata]
MDMKGKPTNIYLFNCDNTCSLDPIESLLLTVQNDAKMRFAVDKRNFRLREMSEMCETLIPGLQMDFAIFAVNAHESRLSINEDNAGIGYANIYRALQEATGGKVLIVIGEDNNYKDSDEKDRSVISRWSRGKVASQFGEEYLDGRQSFIFSWNKKHREIHEQALLHYFDPSKTGKKFEYQPKPKPQPEQRLELTSEPLSRMEISLGDSREMLLPKDIAKQEKPFIETEVAVERRQQEKKEEKGSTVKNETAMGQDYPAGTVLLETRLVNGEISYQKRHIVKRQDDWQPSETQVSNLRDSYRLIGNVSVRFEATGNNGGIHYRVFNTTWWRKCLDCFKDCFPCLCPPFSCKCPLSSCICKHIDIAAMSQDYPTGTVLLETRLVYGEISYKKWHIVKRLVEWQPSEDQISNLRDSHRLIGNFSVRFVAADNNGGIMYKVFNTPRWRKCLDCFKMCFPCLCLPCPCKC